MAEETALHTKYRPKTLDEVIGHEKAVTAFKGYVETKKWPSAIALLGPTSAGKTTLAHALASSEFGVKAKGHPDFFEINASDSKTIDDVRALITLSKYRPQKGKRRFIFIDEAQGLLSNKQALKCVAPETLLQTQHGLETARRVHERILTGEDVLLASFNHTTNQVEMKRVLVSARKPNDKPCVSVNNSVLTEDHHVFTVAAGYLPANEVSQATGITFTAGTPLSR